MKKAMGLIFSGIIMLPAIAWGASAVKALGGAGTYSGVTSVGTGSKTGTRVLRAGSVRTTPTVKTGTTTMSSSDAVAKSGTTTSSASNQSRISIGKYLSGTGVISSSSGSSPSGSPSHGGTSELERDVQALHDKLADLEAAGYITSDDIDEYLKTADLNLDGYVTDAELNDYVKSDAIKDFLTADDLSGYVKSDAIQNFLTASDLNGYVKSTELNLDNYLTSEDLTGLVTSDTLNTSLGGYVKADELGTQVASQITSELADRDLVTSSDLNDYVKSTELNLDGYLVNDAENPYVQQSALDGFLTDDTENPYIQQSSLNNYVQKDTLEQLAYRSYVDTIVNNLNTTQADVNSLSEQIQNIQVSNMPDVPTCSGGSCTYMLLDNGGETKTWKEISVVDEFHADQMN